MSNNFLVSPLSSCFLQAGLEKEQAHHGRAALFSELSEMETAGFTPAVHIVWEGILKGRGQGQNSWVPAFVAMIHPGTSTDVILDASTFCTGR